MKALDKALSFLSRRSYSEAELRRKLYAAKFEAAEIAEALEKCKKTGLINDALLAEDCAADLAGKNYGNMQIVRKLKEKGVAPHIRSAMEELSSDEVERAKTALEYKLRLLTKETDMRKKREKCLRFLLGRGFSMHNAVQAWNEYKKTAAEAMDSEND